MQNQNNQHAERLREMAGKFKNHADLNRDDALSVRNGHVLRMYVEELDGYASDVSAAADALEREAGLVADAERARWCEEKRATVSYNGITRKWTVIADELMPWRRRYFDSPDRNAAIDAAMKGGK